jgi:invasion protein IalB
MIGIRRCLVSMLAISAATLAAPSSAGAAQPKKPAAPAAASQPATPQPGTSATRTLGTFAGWTAYASQDKTGRVCYLVGQAQKSEPAGFPRKAPMAIVTHRPTEQIANVVSFVKGYPLKAGSVVSVDIGGATTRRECAPHSSRRPVTQRELKQ